MQAEGVGGDGHEGPAGLGAAEDGALDRLHVAAQRTGGVDHVVDVTAFLADVLEGVQMSADVHIHVVMFEKHGVHPVLHIGTLTLVLVGIGIDGMVPYYDDPVLIGLGQGFVQPCQLLAVVRLEGIRILVGLLPVLVYNRSGVDHHDTYLNTVLLLDEGVIARRHVPAGTHLRVIDAGLGIAAVLVVAADCIPGGHQVGMGVDELVVGHPQRVTDTLYALEVMHVSGRNHKLDVDGLGHPAHSPGNGFLVIVAIAAQVVGDVEVKRLLESLPLLGAVLLRGRGHVHGSVAGHCCQGQYRSSGGKGKKIDSFHKAVCLLILPALIIHRMLRTMRRRRGRYRSDH